MIRPRFYILNPTLPTIQTNLWGFDLEKDFHLILELGTNSILLGNCLLDYCDVLKIYRKYQDNKDYERDLEENQQVVNAFDSLRDIIRRYGLPTNHSGTSQVCGLHFANMFTILNNVLRRFCHIKNRIQYT